MEDQLGALGLVVNVLVLWTTLYMDRALAQLRSRGAVVNDDDIARLSPLARTTSTSSGATTFRCLRRSSAASSGRYVTPPTSTTRTCSFQNAAAEDL